MLFLSGHYNPWSVDLAGNYAQECSPTNPLRCESGDMSGKHGKIGIRTDKKIMKRDFFTDVDLQLSGANSILHRAIVVHDAASGAGRLACADIFEVPKKIIKV